MNLAERLFARAGVVTGGVVLSVVVATGGAQAYAYDGGDPSSTGCSSSASTVESATVRNGAGAAFGTIELRYSSTCRTAWARFTMNFTQDACGNAAAGTACPTADVIRNNDGRDYGCTIHQGQSSCYTPQVNDAGMTSFAQGFVDAASGQAHTRTSSY